MKTLGRVLVILIAFTIMMGITYSAVSASGSSNNAPAFQRGADGQRELRDVNNGGSGLGMLFGLLKNMIIVSVIVALVALPKNFLQQKRRAVPIRIN